jgi:thymidine phosphorylase
LGGALLEQAGMSDGTSKIGQAIANGVAAEKFGAMVYAMGGPVHFVEDWARFLPEAPVIREVTASTCGTVTAIDGEALGLTVVALGGGRQVETDVVNPAVGLSDVVSVGDRVTKGQPLARIHAARESQADEAEQAVRAAITLGDGPATAPALVLEHIT